MPPAPGQGTPPAQPPAALDAQPPAALDRAVKCEKRDWHSPYPGGQCRSSLTQHCHQHLRQQGLQGGPGASSSGFRVKGQILTGDLRIGTSSQSPVRVRLCFPITCQDCVYFSEFALVFINLKQMDIQDAKLILTITIRLSLGSPDLFWVL